MDKPQEQQGVEVTVTTKSQPAMMFRVLDPEGFDIFLDSERWEHILEGHPEMEAHLERLKMTVQLPQVIQRELEDSETHYYYRLTERSQKAGQDVYINAVVQRVESTKGGMVKTAFIVKTIRKHGELVWMSARKN